MLGTTQPLPNRVARVSTAVEGHVLTVLPGAKGKAVVESQRVDAEQVLVQLDDRVLRANGAKLVAGDVELKEQINQAGNAVELARLDTDRLEKLQGPALPRCNLSHASSWTRPASPSRTPSPSRRARRPRRRSPAPS